MNPFIETATEAVSQPIPDINLLSHHEIRQWFARTALASLTQHRDDIARALWEHDVSQTPWAYASAEERALYLSMADAVLAAFTADTK